MFVKPEGPLEDTKTDAKHLNFSTYIYIFYYQSSIDICLLVPKKMLLIFRIFDIKADLPEFRNSENAKFSSLTSWLYATDVSNHE